MTSPALQYTSTLSHKHTIFETVLFEHKMHVLIFSITIFGKVSHFKKQYHVVQNWKCSGDKVLINGILDILKLFQVYIINTGSNDK